MYKSTSQGENFISRAGEFSTHASRSGKNLLGWELPENLEPEQQRDCLVARVKQLHLLVKCRLSEADRYQVGQELCRLNSMINALRPAKRNPGVETYVIEILREDLPKKQFDILMGRAAARFEASKK